MGGLLSPLRTTLVVTFSALLLAPAAEAWTWPVSGPVLRAFSLGADPYAAGQHRGIDIGGGAAEPVVAPRAGTISFAGSMPTNGLTVTIQTDEGYSVTLVHLGSVAVRRNATVAEGGTIGTVGPSGEREWPVPYVHLGVRTTADPNGYLDPLLFLPPKPAPGDSISAVSEPQPHSAHAREARRRRFATIAWRSRRLRARLEFARARRAPREERLPGRGSTSPNAVLGRSPTPSRRVP